MKVKSEKEMRRDILATAKRLGCDHEAKKIFDRYDSLIKKCTNEKEKKDMAVMGIAELHRLFGCRGALIINGQVVIPGEMDDEDDGRKIRPIS